MIVFFFGKELKKRYEITREINELQEQIKSLERTNKDSAELVKYLKTIEYQERQARSLLGLQKQGEFAVNLPFQEVENATTETTKQESNFRKWWNYFFHK